MYYQQDRSEIQFQLQEVLRGRLKFVWGIRELDTEEYQYDSDKKILEATVKILSCKLKLGMLI